MSESYVDTDVIIRLLTGDDPAKQAAAKALFEEVEQGRLTLVAPDTVIADAVYVLSSPRLYSLSRAQVSALLTPLVRLTHFEVQNKTAVSQALALYETTNLDFGDLLIVASMRHAHADTLYSYDKDFDRIPGVIRREPA
ncbi:MAG: PIN domain-containing protein [Ktedonobacterales bacterium]